MKFVALIVLLVSCVSLTKGIPSDSARAEETLTAQGFTHIELQDTSSARWYLCSPLADTCTPFTAVSPWAWKVVGVVECYTVDTCVVHVIFRAKKAIHNEPS